jgi:hypothetical protein
MLLCPIILASPLAVAFVDPGLCASCAAGAVDDCRVGGHIYVIESINVK